jgi:EamA domain-containing membrane protein RarD
MPTLELAATARFWVFIWNPKELFVLIFSLGYFLQSFQDAPLVVYLAHLSYVCIHIMFDIQ